MHSAPALLEGNVALAGRSQKRFYAAQRKASCLKTQGDIEKHNRRQRTNRLVATNHNVKDVDWLRGLNEDIAWIEGDPIQEISQQLNQNRKAGKTIDELHIVAHGSNGEVKLGNTFLTKRYLEESSLLLQEWKVEAIYLWSCEAGLNTDLITALQACTEADIYSSKTRISREKPKIYSRGENTTSLEELIGFKQLQLWKGTLFAAPLLGKSSSSYEEITLSVDTIASYASSPPTGLTITAQTLVDDGAGNISLSAASISNISVVDDFWIKGFGVTGNIATGDTRELGYHSPSGLSEQITIEFGEIVYTIGFATAWLADSEGDGIYKMYRNSTLVKTGAVDGVTDLIDPDVTLATDDGLGFDKIEFTANGYHNDYLIHKIIYAKSNANNVTTTSINELDDASSQDIAPQTGSLSISDSDNEGTITASIVGDPIVTLNGSTFSLPAAASNLTADGAMSLSPTSQTLGGSWIPITWTYDPNSADLDFIPAGQDLVIAYDIQLNDGVNDSNKERVEITIVGENDPPEISDATYTLSEDTAAGTIFHDTDEDSTGNDTDIESETITYSITAGNPDGIFAMDSNTGEISIATGQSLDYETTNQHILTVEASDSAESDTANVTVNINNVRPTIALSSDVASLKAGETAAISFTLSETSTNFIESDITVDGGTLSNFSGSGTSYSATFTPTADSTSEGVIHVANDKFSDGAGDNNQDESDANNTVTLTVDTNSITIEQTENSQKEKITTPKDLNESFDSGQTSTITPISGQANEGSNQLLNTFGTDILTNYYEFQPKILFAQYSSLLGDSGGGGQILKPPSDGGTAQERGVRIIANSFCSTLDDSITQHDASTNDTFFVVLTGAPTSGVKVSLKAPDSLEGMLSSDELYFTSENWNIPQKVTFLAESLGAPIKDERFKLTAIASKEGGYTGTEKDSAIFNNSEKSIKQASTEIKRAGNPFEVNPVNLDVERITAHEELSPMFTILRIISFPAVAFISFALNSIERFQSDISPSSQSIDQNNKHHQTSAFQIEPIEVNHLSGVGSESYFHLTDSSQDYASTNSLLLAQTNQPTDYYF